MAGSESSTRTTRLSGELDSQYTTYRDENDMTDAEAMRSLVRSGLSQNGGEIFADAFVRWATYSVFVMVLLPILSALLYGVSWVWQLGVLSQIALGCLLLSFALLATNVTLTGLFLAGVFEWLDSLVNET